MRVLPNQKRFFRGYVSILILLVLIGNCLSVAAAQSDDDLKNLSQNLITLRGEVQDLNNQLKTATDNHRNRMQSLERQRGDLEARLKRTEGVLRKQRNSLEKALKEAAGNDGGDNDLKQLAQTAIKDSRARVKAGLPFKIEERIAELDQIESQINKGILPPHQAINRLWAFTEDELRMVSENGLYRQPVSIDGEKHLAEVVRLGMSILFFETSDGRYGSARKDGALWNFETFSEREQIEQVATLFDSFRKQIRTGYFTLPNVLTSEVPR